MAAETLRAVAAEARQAATTWSPDCTVVTSAPTASTTPGALVAQHDRAVERRSAQLPIDDVQVAVAHAGGHGAHEHLAAPRLVDVDALDGQRFVGLAVDGGLGIHRSPYMGAPTGLEPPCSSASGTVALLDTWLPRAGRGRRVLGHHLGGEQLDGAHRLRVAEIAPLERADEVVGAGGDVLVHVLADGVRGAGQRHAAQPVGMRPTLLLIEALELGVDVPPRLSRGQPGGAIADEAERAVLGVTGTA